MHLSVVNKIRVCFSLALLILIFIAVGAYDSARLFLELTRQMTQSSDGLQALNVALSALKDAETGQRGYLLTQDKAYLTTYETAIQELPSQIATVQRWSDERPDIEPQVVQFVELAELKRAELKQTILLNDQQSLGAAMAVVRTDEGRRLMDELCAVAGTIELRQMHLLRDLLRRSTSAGQRSLYTALFGVGVAGALVLLLLVLISRDLTGRSRLGEMARTITAEHLAANEHLRLENVVRRQAQDAHQRAEEQVRELNAGLEERVLQRTAQLETANKELEAFSYSVSHDLRSPLRAINGFSQALQEETADTLSQTGQEYLGRIIKASNRMSQLIDDLLNLARVSRSQLLRESVDMTGVVRSVVADLQEQDPQRHVDVVVAPNVTADGDPKLLRVALENLLGNAWKFTGKRSLGKIEFGISPEPGVHTFFVRDNGAGFDPAFTEKLFGVFQRLHSPEEFPGTGIGLATVQRIIHRHGGRIWADAAQEQGATFYFSL